MENDEDQGLILIVATVPYTDGGGSVLIVVVMSCIHDDVDDDDDDDDDDDKDNDTTMESGIKGDMRKGDSIVDRNELPAPSSQKWFTFGIKPRKRKNYSGKRFSFGSSKSCTIRLDRTAPALRVL
uniref:Uncharacterized protein n=1 Tax=Vespula pensylvanica TaxID=30213 RepID=A0A834U5D4_VESPE|nr:hypothetical protein H0235_011639 [Vespula pensylvanica]